MTQSVTTCAVNPRSLPETGKDILQISTVSVVESDVVEVLVLFPLPDMGRSRLEYFTLPVMLPQGEV